MLGLRIEVKIGLYISQDKTRYKLSQIDCEVDRKLF